MNHIARNFVAPDGKAFKSHAWELREGGYRRIAVVLGYPFWPVAREKRLVSFLLDRGFMVHALEIDFTGLGGKQPDLGSMRSAAAAFVSSLGKGSDLPIYLIVSSFCAMAAPAFHGLQGLVAAAFVAPVLDYPPAGTAVSRCFLKPTALLRVSPESISGKGELIAELMNESRLVKFSKRDLRSLAAEDTGSMISGLGVPTAAFIGEEDPFIPEGRRQALASAGVKLYTYLRVRHAPAYDKYADNFYADLGSFVDQVEVGRATKGMWGAKEED